MSWLETSSQTRQQGRPIHLTLHPFWAVHALQMHLNPLLVQVYIDILHASPIDWLRDCFFVDRSQPVKTTLKPSLDSLSSMLHEHQYYDFTTKKYHKKGSLWFHENKVDICACGHIIRSRGFQRCCIQEYHQVSACPCINTSSTPECRKDKPCRGTPSIGIGIYLGCFLPLGNSAISRELVRHRHTHHSVSESS